MTPHGTLLTVFLLTFTNRAAIAVLNPGCECVTYQGHRGRMSGTFTSPGYPLPYRGGNSCILYSFIAPASSHMIVEVIFTDLQLGNISSTPSCNSGDKLRIFLSQPEPYINELVTPDTQICGNLSVLSTSSFYSSGRILIIEYSAERTGRPANFTRFKGVYNFLDASQFRSDGNRQYGEQCVYYILSAIKKDGKFFSPFYPQNYRSNMTCAWIFKGDWDERVVVTFLKIDLATRGVVDEIVYSVSLINNGTHPNRTCDVDNHRNDLITVFDGDNTKAPVISRYCGRQHHEEVISSGMRLLITFSSNQHYNMQGFTAIYRFIKDKPEEPPLQKCDQVITSALLKSGFIVSANYPGPYTSGSVCTYTFHGDENERVVIEFSDFDLGSSNSRRSEPDCKLEDKITASIKVNNTYQTTLAVLCGSRMPPSMMSNGEFLQLKFEAFTQVTQARGYNFTFKFLNDFGIKSDERVPYVPCVNRYQSKKKLSGEIVSPNYPGLYPRDTKCTYIFDGDGRRVHINFTHFDIIGQPPACLEDQNSDYVSFSNFYLADDKKMSRYCTNNKIYTSQILSSPIVSDTDFFRLNFHSGMLHSGTGFRAIYTFIDVPREDSESQAVIADEAKGNSCRRQASFFSYISLMFLMAISNLV